MAQYLTKEERRQIEAAILAACNGVTRTNPQIIAHPEVARFRARTSRFTLARMVRSLHRRGYLYRNGNTNRALYRLTEDGLHFITCYGIGKMI